VARLPGLGEAKPRKTGPDGPDENTFYLARQGANRPRAAGRTAGAADGTEFFALRV